MSGQNAGFDDGDLRVVVNQEEQYSIWPVDRDLPSGWQEIGFTGRKKDCLEHIKKIWTDLRPLSLRKHMENLDQNSANCAMLETGDRENDTHKVKGEQYELVDFLSAGDHPVKLELKSDTKDVELQNAINKGYVVIRFSDTRGGTDLGIRIERDLCVLDNCDVQILRGRMQIVGTVVLNNIRVRCTADINLEDCLGTGHLDRI
ncbi:MAG: MbtH family protein [Nitrospirales bacterium]